MPLDIGLAMILSTLLSGGVSVGSTLLGGSANEKAMDEAREESRALDARNFAETQRVNRFNEKMSKENLALSKESLGIQKNRFALDNLMSMYGINGDQIAKVENILNKNVGLQNRVLQMWSNIGG